MKKTLLAITSALVLAGAMSSTASAQSAYAGYNGYSGYSGYEGDSSYDDDYSDYSDSNRDGVDDRYAGPRDSQRDLGLDYDHDGVADVYDDDDDNDGLPDRMDPNDHDDRDGRAYAQGRRYDDRGGRDRDQRDQRYDRDQSYARPGRYGDGRHDNGHHNGRHMAQHRYQAGRYRAPRGYAYRQYQVGSRLPMGYYGSSYYVNSAPYELSAPPRGYRWNRVGSDAYLVNSSNGIIRDVIYSLFY